MKLVSAICATALALAGAVPASAQSFSPASGTFVFQGGVVVNKSLTLNCTLKLTVNVTSSTTATVTPSLETPSNPLCPVVTFSGAPYTVTTTSLSVTAHGIVVNTITPGDCFGSISGIWSGNNARPRSISLGDSMPSGGSNLCSISGFVSQVSGPTLSINVP